MGIPSGGFIFWSWCPLVGTLLRIYMYPATWSNMFLELRWYIGIYY